MPPKPRKKKAAPAGMEPQHVEVGQLVQTRSDKHGPVLRKQGSRVRLKDDDTGMEVWREAKDLTLIESLQTEPAGGASPAAAAAAAAAAAPAGDRDLSLAVSRFANLSLTAG